MKTIKFLLIFLLLLGFQNNSISQTATQKKVIDSRTLNRTLANKKTILKTTTITKEEEMCKPMNIRSTEDILKNKVGRSIKVMLDKDYGFVEILGKKHDVNFGEYKVSKAGNDWVYTLNNINSSITRVSFIRGTYVLKIEFETDDVEIKGRCPGCRIGKDRRAPDINWRDPALLVYLNPAAYNNSFTFEVSKVQMSGKFEFNGMMDTFLPSITRFFRSKMENAFKSHMERTFNSSQVKNMLAEAFKPEVAKLGISKVKNVDMSDSQIFLCNYIDQTMERAVQN